MRAKDRSQERYPADPDGAEFGVKSSGTIHWTTRAAILADQQTTPAVPWRVPLFHEVRQQLSDGNTPEDCPSLSKASRCLGASKSHVTYLVKNGWNEAARITFRNRQDRRINLDSATCGRHAKTFEQMTNNNTKEA